MDPAPHLSPVARLLRGSGLPRGGMPGGGHARRDDRAFPDDRPGRGGGWRSVGYWLSDLARSGQPLRRVLVTDGILALALAVVSVSVGLEATGMEGGPVSGALWLLILAPSVPVPFRRIAPIPAAVAGCLFQVAQWALARPDTFLATGVLLYSAAAYGGRAGRRAAWAGSAFVTAFTGLGHRLGEAPLYSVALVALFSVAASALGQGTARRTAYIDAVEARVAEAERTRRTEQERARAEERNRVARELHDVVAHGLSVMVVQASAAQRILDRDPEGARQALGQIERTGRNALNEMRHVLSVIRTDPADSWRPAPGLAGLDDLVRDLTRTGLTIEVSVAGLPHATPGITDGDPLPATVDLTAYRIIQESLTNVLKHAGQGATARVTVTRTRASLDLSIIDDGLGAAAEHNRGGHGLRGMEERVELFGGRFRAGPAPGTGFAVEVSLPIDSVATAPAGPGFTGSPGASGTPGVLGGRE